MLFRSTPRVTRILILASTLVLAVSACGSESSDAGDETDRPATTERSTTSEAAASTPVAPRPSEGCAADGAPAAGEDRGTHVEVELDTDDGPRTYLRYVPTEAPDSPRPLVIDLHGYLSVATMHTQLTGMDQVADREGFVLATPQGSGDLSYWNAVPESTLPDDVAFIEAVIDDVGADLCIDESRVYVDGFSNGAFLTSLLACRLADRVAAVAAVSGLQDPADCDPSRPVPVFAIHGTADTFVGYDGPPNPALETLQWNADSTLAFRDLPFAPVEESAAAWAERNGCEPDPAAPEVTGDVSTIAYQGCADGAEVVLATVDGGGHSWPSSEFTKTTESLVGPTTFDLDASQEIWAFFADHPLP